MAFEGIDTTRLLLTGMRVAEMNHRIIANNVANVETPRFSPATLDFQKTLSDMLEGRGRVSLRKTRARHLEKSKIQPKLERVAVLSKNDYNKVDLDQEMVDLSKNTGRYTSYGSILVKRFDGIQNMLQNLR